MDIIKLNICREKALLGCLMPYRIIFNGEEKSKLKNGKSISLEMQNAQSTLKVSMVGNSMNLHNIEKDVLLLPQYCKTGIINCVIRTKINLLGFVTMGLFQAIGTILIDIEYC